MPPASSLQPHAMPCRAPVLAAMRVRPPSLRPSMGRFTRPTSGLTHGGGGWYCRFPYVGAHFTLACLTIGPPFPSVPFACLLRPSWGVFGALPCGPSHPPPPSAPPPLPPSSLSLLPTSSISHDRLSARRVSDRPTPSTSPLFPYSSTAASRFPFASFRRRLKITCTSVILTSPSGIGLPVAVRHLLTAHFSSVLWSHSCKRKFTVTVTILLHLA